MFLFSSIMQYVKEQEEYWTTL